MIGESVRNVRLSGAPHSDQVGCFTSSFRGDVGNNVAPEVSRGRVAMKKDDCSFKTSPVST